MDQLFILLLVVLGLVLNVAFVIAHWRLAAAAKLIAKDYDAVSTRTARAVEEQSVSLKVLAEHLRAEKPKA
jgi:hypothetical protein